VKSSLLRQALILVTLAFIPGIGQAIYYRDRVSWESRIPLSELVRVAQAKSWGQNALWVDARPEADFEADHVPGALPLDEDRWNELLPQFLAAWSPEKKVIVYCSTQSCNLAIEVAQRLRNEAQIKNVFVLQGGWEEWLKEKK
jgi:rhodanese-related sulfurtransferase